jgi:predicted porin
MKKSLIALAALSAFGTAAQAQSSVQVYGLLDTSTGSTETRTVADGAAQTKTKTSGPGSIANGALAGSRLGFRGAEDLGGGLSATFNIEYQLQTAVGGITTGDGVAARTSTVGLTDKAMGTLEVGRQTTGIHSVIAGLNPLGGSNMAGDASYSAATRLHTTEVRTNGLVYKSPTINGFNARVDYAYGVTAETETANSGSKSDNLGLSVNYAAGNLKVSAGTHKTDTKNALRSAVNGLDSSAATTTSTAASNIVQPISAITAAADETKATVNVVAAQYLIGKTTLFGLYGTRKVETEASSVFAQSAKAKQTQIGVSYPVTAALTLSGIYGEGETQGASAVANNRDTKSYLAAAVYSLSKRTNVYAAYGYEQSKLAVDTASSSIDDGDYVKTKQVQVGLRHSF